jgi:hypothetical protein
MINPIATLLFDLFVTGSAATIILSLIRESRVQRLPCVGTKKRPQFALPTALRPSASSHDRLPARTAATLRRVA